MYLNNKFEYGNKKIPFRDRNVFMQSRNIKHLGYYEKMLGEGNYCVYSSTEKVKLKGGKYSTNSIWVLMTTNNKLTEHYEVKQKGDGNV